MSTLREYINDAFSDLSKGRKLKYGRISKECFLDRLRENSSIISYSSEYYVDFLMWPGNAFILTVSLLGLTGGYKKLISGDKIWTIEDRERADYTGQVWNNFINSSFGDLYSEIEPVINAIQSVVNHLTVHKSIVDLLGDDVFVINLLVLCVASDRCLVRVIQKSERTGLLRNDKSIQDIIFAELKLTHDDFKFQLSYSNRTLGSVHYKSAVCQSGISLSSISHNVAFIKPEVELNFIARTSDESSSLLNILILPFPLNISRNSFKPVKNQNYLEMDDDFGFFTYQPDCELDAQDVLRLITKATNEVGDIDIVALPECAVSQSTLLDIECGIKDFFKAQPEKCPSVIVGVYNQPINSFGGNSLTLIVPDEGMNSGLSFSKVNQDKHHRWFLDKSQILNYKLGTSLAINKKWWEFTSIEDRTLISFYSQKHNIQISPLICEDLARQDPVAPVVRALGPNLIIALLLDGAQIKNRWPGRYAALLSDDPGSCVLTISPLGMTHRSDGTGFPPSRNVAFWSEPNSTKELLLQEGKEGIILTLEKVELEQWTADGRKQTRAGLTYAGHLCI